MASFFEKISKTGHKTMQKVKDTSEITKLNEMISMEQNKQTLTYADLGRAFYEAIDSGAMLATDSESVAVLISSIRESNAKIKKFNDDILRIKNVKRCPACGRECSDDSLFCSGCGNQLPEQNNPSEASTHCMNCGAEIAQDDLFCFSCGKKIER